MYKINIIRNYIFFFVFISLLTQLFIIVLNNKSNDYFNQQNNSLDSFETIMFNKDGNNTIKADKLIYIDEDHTLLKGVSSLTNENYVVKSFDIMVNFNTGNAESASKTDLTNKTTKVNSEGFKINNSSNLIYFFGNTVVLFNDN